MVTKIHKSLQDQKLTLYAEKNGVLTYSSDRPGIRALLRGVTEFPNAFRGAKVADRVLGIASAYLLAHGQIREVDADIATQEAIDFLISQGINAQATEIVEKLVHGRFNEPCQFEQLASESGGVVLFLDKLQRRLN